MSRRLALSQLFRWKHLFRVILFAKYYFFHNKLILLLLACDFYCSIYFKFHIGITIDDYVGNWESQREKAQIVFERVSDISIQCAYPNLGRQTFTIDGATIKWDGGDITGSYSDDGSITWNTGSRWEKLGTQTIINHISFVK